MGEDCPLDSVYCQLQRHHGRDTHLLLRDWIVSERLLLSHGTCFLFFVAGLWQTFVLGYYYLKIELLKPSLRVHYRQLKALFVKRISWKELAAVVTGAKS